MIQYEYIKDALANVKKPCAFLLLEAFEANMNEILANAHNKKIRVASKSVRSVDILREIFAKSPVFQGVMCFTADEALYLYEQGFDDLLIAYPVWDENLLGEIALLVKAGAKITVMVDSSAHLNRLDSIAKQVDAQFLVCVDIDLSYQFFGLHFGVYRSPLKTVKDVQSIIEEIISTDTLHLTGLMGYEAQIAGVTDAAPNQFLKNLLIRFLKGKSAKTISQKRQEIYQYIKAKKIQLEFINGGGTGSLQQSALEPYITEVTVGSGFFNPHLFDKYVDFKFDFAAGFAIEITRIPKEGMLTCFGGGYVASGAAGKDRLPELVLPVGARLTTNEGVGEVQTPVIYRGPLKLQHGDPIILRHSKAGELCERFHELHLIENGKVSKKVNTYRGDGKCFL